MPSSNTDNHDKRVESEYKKKFCTSQPSLRTYFISGFDPRGAAHYLGLFQKELRERGYRTGKKSSKGLITTWPIQAINDSTQIGSNGCHSELSFLHWDDIARANWPRQPLEILGQCFRYASFYLFRGTIIHIARLCPGVALCGAYPLLFLIFSFGTAIAIGNLTYTSLKIFSTPDLTRIFVGLVGTCLTLWGSWKIADRIGVTWLTRSILFTHRLGQARDKGLRERVQMLAFELTNLEKENPAEAIRLVGHSSGSFVMAMLAAELKRNPDSSQLLERVELLTLGQNLANLSVYPDANSFREDLKLLASDPKLPWRDITSKEDLLCFAGVDPFKSCGLTRPTGEEYPKMEVISLVMKKPMRQQKYLFLNQFTLHFDYLRNYCPGVDLPGLLVTDPRKESNA